MKWFKHDSDSHLDAKLQKVKIKYGMEGYGLYWYLLELIAMNVTEHKLTFELEHDSEIIAHNTGIHEERIKEMVRFMIEQNLLDANNGIITCFSMALRLDQSMTSNQKMRSMIAKIKENHDGVMTESCKKRREENRIEENKGTRMREDYPLEQEWVEFAKSERPDLDPERIFLGFRDYWLSVSGQKGVKKDWFATWRNWVRNQKNFDKPNTPNNNQPSKKIKPFPGMED